MLKLLDDMKVKHNILLLLFSVNAVFCYTTLSAQQQPIFTQYMFNGLVVNPAYSGSHESITLTASGRRQWSSIKGAPQTEMVSAHSPIKFSRSAAGLVAMHDQVGVTNQSVIYGTYAYRIPVSQNGKIAVGAQAGATFYRANFSKLDIVSQNNIPDDAFAKDNSRVLPNFGVGIYYNDKKTYVGLSVPTLVNNKWNNYDPLNKATQERHYYLTAGHVFTLSPNLKFKPNTLIKWVENGPFQYDINANFLIHEVFWIGVSYRMKDSFDLLLQWNINDQLSLGYSYGYPVNLLSTLQAGTHEMVINYRLKQKKHIVLSPRYF
jgi:type IX secretion system PorP/SprF family membrane protein